MKLIEKMQNNEKKIKEQKECIQKENEKKYNQLYLSRQDKQLQLQRSEKAFAFSRQQQMNKINERMERI